MVYLWIVYVYVSSLYSKSISAYFSEFSSTNIYKSYLRLPSVLYYVCMMHTMMPNQLDAVGIQSSESLLMWHSNLRHVWTVAEHSSWTSSLKIRTTLYISVEDKGCFKLKGAGGVALRRKIILNNFAFLFQILDYRVCSCSYVHLHSYNEWAWFCYKNISYPEWTG